MPGKSFITCLLLLMGIGASAQGGYDECINATPIPSVMDYCSQAQAFSNEGATNSEREAPDCFPDESQRDVWFSFVAEATDVNIRVIGATRLGAGGTLRSPQLGIYRGNCDDLTLLQCISDNSNNNVVQTFENELVIGDTYYIRVSARGQNTGTFQLCVNNFNATPEPSSDCATGVVLCDKSPFTVDIVRDFGNVRDPIPDVFCAGFFPVEEEQSTWFKWICDEAGSLEFTITPLNPDDDIDWALYELPGGIDDCSEKRLLRYNISGEVVGAPRDQWEGCTGATGIREGDDDEAEDCGCDPGDDNFSRSIDMVPGRAYTLVIINYSQSGFGYSLSFGGDGTFEGPEANFATDLNGATACVGQPVTFTDASSFAGGLTDWEWNFGPTARTTETTGEGPHDITFDRPGMKPVLLRVTSVDGCVVSRVGTVEVVCCTDHFTADGAVSDLRCPSQPEGAIDLDVNSNYPIASYEWSDGSTTEDLNGLPEGDYEVRVIDEATCDSTFQFTIDAPEEFSLEAAIDMPTCNGGTDGAVTLQSAGATAPYRYSFGGGPLTQQSTFSNLAIGDYTVSIIDGNDCTFDTTLTVRELELQLDPAIDPVSSPLCNGESSGAINVIINNGQGPFQYDFNDGRGFQDDRVLENIPQGVYQVSVRDQNLCEGNFSFEVNDFAPVSANADRNDVSCFGLDDGSIVMAGTGGTGTYSYNWANGSTRPDRFNLPPGMYPVRVTDGNNCQFDTTLQITEPPELLISDINVINALCFGDENGQLQLLGDGGNPPYRYTINDSSFQDENLFLGLSAGTYSVRIEDAEGCTISEEVTIDQPAQLTVDAGPDQIIRLGEEADLRAVANFLPVIYQWNPTDLLTCSDCSSPIAFPVNTTTFNISIEDPTGCTATDEVVVSVAKLRDLYIPNAFSPNGDGDNDYFTIYAGPDVESIELLRIFDRWGNLVYQGQDIPPGSEGEVLGWDGIYQGRELDSAVFTYVAEIRFIDQVTEVYKGDITLMR